MKRAAILSVIFFTMHLFALAQSVAINTTGAAADASARLDLNSGNAGSKGFLTPQVALTALNAAGPIASPATGLLVYNTATANSGAAAPPNSVVPGYYYWNGAAWVYLVDNTKSSISLPYFGSGGLTNFHYYAPGYAGTAHIVTPTSISYTYAYLGDNNYIVASNGHFSKAYGWLSATVGAAFDYVDVYAYLYSPVTNSSANIVGVQIGHVQVEVKAAFKNYAWEMTGNAALTKGQFIMIFYSPQYFAAGTFLYASGTLECTYIPQ